MADVTTTQATQQQPALILWLTERSPRHQQAAIDAAPPGTTVDVLRHADRDAILARLPDADFLISERAGVIDAAMIRAGTKLRLIQRLGTLTHDIDAREYFCKVQTNFDCAGALNRELPCHFR